MQRFSVSPSVGAALSRHLGDSAVTGGRVTMSDSTGVQKVSEMPELPKLLIGFWFGLSEVASGVQTFSSC